MSKGIVQIDRNFAFNTQFDESLLNVIKASDVRLSLHGIFHDGNEYLRMPSDIASKISENVSILNKNTAGGRVRFRTDSECITLRCEMDHIDRVPHMPLTGTSGFDMYCCNDFIHAFAPSFNSVGGYSGVHWFNDKRMRDITINFPLYNGVKELYIGFDKSAQILPAIPYTHALPIVSYGSSITQGGCASRPGRSYQSIISRQLDADFINLGFSGSALGEIEVAHYIASLSMDVFIFDYDCNAPSPEHLSKTHKPFFDIVRKAHPFLPIIFMTRPYTGSELRWQKQHDIVKSTYEQALESGDKNVYFIDGMAMFPSSECTVDLTHPNDYGFECMAEKIIPPIRLIYDSLG